MTRLEHPNAGAYAKATGVREGNLEDVHLEGTVLLPASLSVESASIAFASCIQSHHYLTECIYQLCSESQQRDGNLEDVDKFEGLPPPPSVESASISFASCIQSLRA